MEIIREPLAAPGRSVIEVMLPVDRHTISKLRWRGVAEDGKEFGFDLSEPIHDNEAFFYLDGTTYIIAQQPEAVLEIAVPPARADAARIGWLVGNLHFSIEVTTDVIRVADDSALRQVLLREDIAFEEVSRVFHPFRHAHVH
jgi:urease accessory protein